MNSNLISTNAIRSGLKALLLSLTCSRCSRPGLEDGSPGLSWSQPQNEQNGVRRYEIIRAFAENPIDDFRSKFSIQICGIETSRSCVFGSGAKDQGSMLGPERDLPDEMNKMPLPEIVPPPQILPLRRGKSAFESVAAIHRIERVMS